MLVQLLGVASCLVSLQAPPPLAVPAPAQKAEPDYRVQARDMAQRAEAWLLAHQDKATGGWGVPEAQTVEKGQDTATPPPPTPPHFPGVTALVLTGILLGEREAPMESGTIPALPRSEVMMGAKYLLNWQQPDGGIYDRVLPSYNTSLAVSALSKIEMPRAREAADNAVAFLKKLQWSEFSDNALGGSEAPKPVERNHPFYGGVGYGKHGRPDGSNMNMFMQALEDAGVPATDDAVKRAMVFLQRLQMTDAANDMPYADGSGQGGFIYATVENAESVDGRAGQSMAGTIEETLDDGTRVSRLRCYGSMTYAGFKSYLYADLDKSDPRVLAAHGWVRRNYTLEENPGLGKSGLYYYLVTFSRALAAWDEQTIVPLDAQGKEGEARDWRKDLVARLATLQSADGSFTSVDKRWNESDPVLITAYALIALRTAVK